MDATFVSGLEVVRDLAAAKHHVRADHAVDADFLELIRNAAKFTPAHGRLTIRSRNINRPQDAGQDRGLIAVEFEDTGVGIDPSVLPRIFEPFEQFHEDLQGRSGGLGLGLAISRSLAEAFGGRLVASSPGPGLGSTFRLELATVPAPVPESPPQPRPVLPGPMPLARGKPGLRILLVDDNADTLRFLSSLLRHRGYDIVTADCLAAARAAVNEAKVPFDLLLSDIALPDGDGMMLMRELKNRTPTPGISVSGFGAEEDRRRSREAGFFEHLIKPVEMGRLEAAIRRGRLRARVGMRVNAHRSTPNRMPLRCDCAWVR